MYSTGSKELWCMGSRSFEGFLSQVAIRLAIRVNTYKSKALADFYGCLSHTLIKANARAILTHSYSHLVQQVDELRAYLFVLCVVVCAYV